jgi:hypothetical protein
MQRVERIERCGNSRREFFFSLILTSSSFELIPVAVMFARPDSGSDCFFSCWGLPDHLPDIDPVRQYAE